MFVYLNRETGDTVRLTRRDRRLDRIERWSCTIEDASGRPASMRHDPVDVEMLRGMLKACTPDDVPGLRKIAAEVHNRIAELGGAKPPRAPRGTARRKAPAKEAE
jgi:hypothetical protein